MTDSSHNSVTTTPSASRTARGRRAWLLTVAAMLAGAAAAIFAMVADGAARASFGAASLVFLATGAYCAMSAWLETRDPAVDLEAPPPVTPLPQSPVTQTYDPDLPPNKSLERSRER